MVPTFLLTLTSIACILQTRYALRCWTRHWKSDKLQECDTERDSTVYCAAISGPITSMRTVSGRYEGMSCLPKDLEKLCGDAHQSTYDVRRLAGKMDLELPPVLKPSGAAVNVCCCQGDGCNDVKYLDHCETMHQVLDSDAATVMNTTSRGLKTASNKLLLLMLILTLLLKLLDQNE